MDAFNLAFHLGYTLMVCTPSAVVRYQWSLLCNKFRPFFFNNTFLFVCFLNWNLVGCFVALLYSFTVELWSCSHWRGKWNGISYFTWESFCALLISKQTFFWFNWKTQFQGPHAFPEEYFHLILQISSTCNYWGGSCVVGKAGLTELHSVPRTWVLLLSVQLIPKLLLGEVLGLPQQAGKYVDFQVANHGQGWSVPEDVKLKSGFLFTLCLWIKDSISSRDLFF